MRVRADVAFKSRRWVPTFINGTSQAYLAVRDWTKLKAGVGFSDDDIRDAKAVCLLGKTVVESLFDGASPLGQEVRIKGMSFRVIGVLAEKGKNAFGMDSDDTISMPWTAAKKLPTPCDPDRKPRPDNVDSIWAKAASREKIPAAIDEIKKVLRRSTILGPLSKTTFTLRTGYGRGTKRP